MKISNSVPKGALGLFGLTIVAAACLSSVSATQTLGAWASTGTHAMSFSNATALGSVEATLPLHVLVGLKMHGSDKAQALVAAMADPASASYHQFLSPAQFSQQFGPTAADAKVVTDYLSAQGFSNLKIAPNNMYVEADGNASVVQAAFNTQLMRYSIGGKPVFANITDVQVPSALSGIVTSVLGLQNATQMHSFLGRKAGTAAGLPLPQLPNIPTELGPHDFEKAYDAAGVPVASSTTIAVFTWGDMSQDVKDLSQFEAEYGLRQVPVNVIKVGFGTSSENDGDGEWDMDMATSSGLAGDLKELRVYAADGGYDVNLIPAFNRFVTDDVAVAGSASFGECEYAELLDGALGLYDQIFLQAATQGQTIFASAGDSGSACYLTGAGLLNGVPLSGAPDTNYPASSPFVMGVGGTTLMVNSDFSYNNEISWNAGGGGPAILEFAPTWQQRVLPAYSYTEVQQGYKGVPDVAMDADFLLSAGKYVLDGSDTSNGGTSLASPLAMGAWARIQGAHKNSLGYAGPVLYALAKPGSNALVLASISGMNDIYIGTNGLYTALLGYDFNTGIGSFDIARVNALVKPTPLGSFPALGGLL